MWTSVTPDQTDRLLIRRHGNYRDTGGNSYGILDVSPDVSDPAILLGIRVAQTGERVQLPLRAGDLIDQPGVHWRVAALDTNDVASITLVAPDA
jgi:hypothetical protein